MTQSLALLSPDLSAGERRLILAAVRGEVADLGEQPVRGSVLRELLDGARPGWLVHASGLKLQRVRIVGGIDLEGCRFDKPLFMSRVVIESDGHRAAMAMEDARLDRVSLHEVRLDGALAADRACFSDGLYLSACDIAGPLLLRGASVQGAFSAEASLIGDGVLALDATQVEVRGPVVLRRARLRGAGRLVRARLDGALQAEAAIFGASGDIPRSGIATEAMDERAEAHASGRDQDRTSPAIAAGGMPSDAVPPALDLSSALVHGDIALSSAGGRGAILACQAEVRGCVSARRLSLTGAGLELAGAALAHGVMLDEARLEGPLGLAGARIGGAVLGRGLEVHGGQVAIAGASVHVSGDVDLERSKLVGVIDGRGAHISGALSLTGARVYGTDEAIMADGIVVGANVALDKAVVFGTVVMGGAAIGRTLSARGASLKVDRGAALSARGVRIGGDALLCAGLRTIGAVVLERACIGGYLSFDESHVTAPALAGDDPGRPAGRSVRAGSGGASLPREDYRNHAIALSDSRMNRLVMPRRGECRPRGIVDLARAHATVFEDYAEAWPPPLDARAAGADGRDGDHLVLAGFVYDELANPGGDEPRPIGAEGPRVGAGRPGQRRIAWLEAQSADDVVFGFRPEAWRQLAARLAAQGLPEDARTVDVARRRWQARSPGQSRLARWRARAFDVIALFGYSPWRPLALLVLTILAFAWLYAWAAGQCPQARCGEAGAFVASQPAAERATEAGGVFPSFDPLAFSLESAVPFIDLGVRRNWQINAQWRPLALAEVLGFEPRRAARPGNSSGDPPAPAGPPRAKATLFASLLAWARLSETVIGVALMFMAMAGFLGLFREEY